MSLTPLGWLIVAVVGGTVAVLVVWWLLLGGYALLGLYVHRHARREPGGYFSGMCQTYACRNWVESYDGIRYCQQCRQTPGFLNRTGPVSS